MVNTGRLSAQCREAYHHIRVKYLFYYDARALMQGVGPIVPIVLCHKDQCAEFMFLLIKVNKFVIPRLGERLNLYIIP